MQFQTDFKISIKYLEREYVVSQVNLDKAYNKPMMISAGS